MEEKELLNEEVFKLKLYQYMVVFNHSRGNGRMFITLQNRGLEGNVSTDDVQYIDGIIAQSNPKATGIFTTDWKLLSVIDSETTFFNSATINEKLWEIGDIVTANTSVENKITKGTDYAIVNCSTDWGFNGIGIKTDTGEVLICNINLFDEKKEEFSLLELFKHANNTNILSIPYIIMYYKDNTKAYDLIWKAVDEGFIEIETYSECPNCSSNDLYDEDTDSERVRCSHCKNLYIINHVIEKCKLKEK